MNAQNIPPPSTWHYGLVARWWAEFNTDGPEIPYIRSLIEQFGQPALDVACGTGRLLLPYLRAGIDVEGCDISEDMLAYCEQRAAQEGLHPRLYHQAMHNLDLPRRYRTIYVCGSFGLGSTRQQDEEALRRFYAHLRSGGALIMDHYLPYQDENEWPLWTPEGQRGLPHSWPDQGKRRRTANGDELELMGRYVAFDPLAQWVKREIRVRLWRDSELLREETYTLHANLYFHQEMLDLLSRAGFHHIHVESDFTSDPATPDSKVLVYIAQP